MKAIITFTKPIFEVPQRNGKSKVYVNFIFIKSLGTLGTIRVNITECNGMLADTLVNN